MVPQSRSQSRKLTKHDPKRVKFSHETYANFSCFSFRNELKITAIHQLKYATDQDFRSIGFSQPEIRRIHKFYDKHCSQGYLNKIKRLLVPKRDEVCNLIFRLLSVT